MIVPGLRGNFFSAVVNIKGGLVFVKNGMRDFVIMGVWGKNH